MEVFVLRSFKRSKPGLVVPSRNGYTVAISNISNISSHKGLIKALARQVMYACMINEKVKETNGRKSRPYENKILKY